MKISGQLVDVHNREIYPAEIEISDGKIGKITRIESAEPYFILPGFVDAHIHIESSMLPPSEFSRIATQHGTISTVSDPHEIANVLGIEGVRFMVEDGKRVPLKFNFGAPSCVPATPFETAGAILSADDVCSLLDWPEIKYLSEVMNFPAVLNDDPGFQKMIAHALKNDLPVDGHAPGLRGEDAKKYAAAGISTDHECFSLDEAIDKISAGMKIIIREGSAAKNYEALKSLLKTHPELCMLCSDDKHPDELMEGHINKLAARAIADGFELFDVLRSCTVNPTTHYKLDHGLLREKDAADFILCSDLKEFNVLATYIDGKSAHHHLKVGPEKLETETPNQFNCSTRKAEDFTIKNEGRRLQVIEAIDKEIISGKLLVDLEPVDQLPSVKHDILTIAVVNRYKDAPIALGVIRNFGLKKGAIASSVAHDSHNIIAVGSSKEAISKAVNLVIENGGGISYADDEVSEILPLPIAGLMSNLSAQDAGRKYAKLDLLAKKAGSKLSAPYMTLSFMGLLVIPSLKIGDKGLFDVDKFDFTPLFI